MKKILIILLLIVPLSAYAQITPLTDREILLKLSEKIDKLAEQQTKLSEKMDKLAEQQIATTLEIKGISTEIKGMQKNIETLFTLILGVLAGVFGLVVMIFYDRRAAMTPIEAKSNALKLENEVFAKEIALLKEKDLKNELVFKKLFEKFPDLAGSL